MPRPSFTSLAGAGLFFLLPSAALAQADLPEGSGKDLVASVCAACHQVSEITRSSGYTRDQWKELIGTMLDLSGTPDKQGEITQYLAAHFPPNTKRASRPVTGDVEITFKEWVTPTLGQRSRDPVEAADGSIWWAGQFANLIGRIDPRTGEIKEYTLPTNAMPHTVEIDAKGNVWYTGNKNGTVGYLDPRTGKITEFKMPDPKAKDPHTLVFDRNGIAWFTLQVSSMVGRLNPKTGEIRLATMTQPNSRPYGIKIDAEGNPWFACNGRPCLVKVNPETMQLAEVKLPLPGTTVRRLDIAGDGIIWYVNSSMGRLGRYDPKTGDIKEWPSPSGPKSHPYAIAVVDGIVWYNESGVRPDMLVRFDPKTEKFQSWPIPSGGVYAGIIRHMRATKDGNLLIHQSSTNRILLVSVKRQAASN